ncbi:hypothetical protein LPAF129_09350 [Ligilactobacillus pabuli]|uniref:NERD domain-containing protein n=1 Tax=Ligilactobacillus pabuli TaxID=2886039 RepID=A0ABQ5JGP9_9LACO|nr:nuclease-related domain-containing protein [Ligilactobacillus pabuli]GKS81249.1 hypothetical protein LPAF129_09350 [Ligilactobacillus pabuli]
MRKKSPELQYLETLQTRTELSYQEKQQLESDRKGFSGELTIDRLTREIVPERTLMLDDLNLLADGQRVQLDKLIQIGNKLYLIDMKDYHGQYSFRGRTWYHNGKPLTHSIFSQIERAHDILARIFAEHHLTIAIVKVIVFTDPSAVIEIEDQSGIIVKYLWEYCEWLQKLCPAVQGTSLRQTRIPWQKVLQKYFVAPYRPETDFALDSRQLWQGIICPRCNNFWWQQEHYALQCKTCDYREAKETAYIRTICDYGVLYFRHNLQVSQLMEFFGEGYSKQYLRKRLAKYFVPMDLKSLQYSYQNRGEKFEYWFASEQQHFNHLKRRINWKK